MLKITFYNVGQGDTILIEWDNKEKKSIGIIDCNKINDSNRIIDYLSVNSITSIEFIILSHFHYDHFSGMSDIFKFCFENNIKIKYFLHTFAPQVLDIYNQIFTSKKVERESELFFKYFEQLDKKIINNIPVHCYTASIPLSDDIFISFFAPDGKTYTDIAKQISRRRNKLTSTYEDINKLSTITCIQNQNSCILLTSDAVKKSFKKIKGKIKKEILIAQAPHHGSFSNIYIEFWTKLNLKVNCPAVFSVGYEPKDKLPHKETVEFFDKNGFDIYSTNCVYGISEYFENASNSDFTRSLCLDHVSKIKKNVHSKPSVSSKFEGDISSSFFK